MIEANTETEQGLATEFSKRVLHLFSGPSGRVDGFAAAIRKAVGTGDEFDIVNGPEEDLAVDQVWEKILARIKSGYYRALLAGPPCNTFTCLVPNVFEFRSNDLEADRDNRPWLAARNDAAVCNFTRKARRPQAAVWSSDQCNKAMEDLRRDYTASSSRGPHASLLRTWEAMHSWMNHGRSDYYPLTCVKITKVAAAFKACG